MKRLMVFVVSLAFLFCGTVFAADKAEKKADVKEPAAATDTAKPEKEKKADTKKADKKKADKKKADKKEKKEKADEKKADAPAK